MAAEEEEVRLRCYPRRIVVCTKELDDVVSYNLRSLIYQGHNRIFQIILGSTRVLTRRPHIRPTFDCTASSLVEAEGSPSPSTQVSPKWLVTVVSLVFIATFIYTVASLCLFSSSLAPHQSPSASHCILHSLTVLWAPILQIQLM